MIEIIPAVLPKNYEDLKNKIALVRGTVPVVQIDLCDGVFVKSMTWPFSTPSEEGIANPELDSHFLNILHEQEGLPFWEDIEFELDLMVHDAVQNFDIYTKLGPKRIIFHLEAEEIQRDVEEFNHFLEGIDMYVRDSIEIGLAVNPNTAIDSFAKIINNIDFVQCMGIDEIGHQGQSFNQKVLENIKVLRERFSSLIISVDGGVNLETGALLVDAGVDRLVVGSAIFNTDDIIDTIERFRDL